MSSFEVFWMLIPILFGVGRVDPHLSVLLNYARCYNSFYSTIFMGSNKIDGFGSTALNCRANLIV